MSKKTVAKDESWQLKKTDVKVVEVMDSRGGMHRALLIRHHLFRVEAQEEARTPWAALTIEGAREMARDLDRCVELALAAQQSPPNSH